jgi:integrase
LYKEESKDRFLTLDEIKTFWAKLEKCTMTDGTRQALKLILVTGQRPGEVVSIHRDEVEGNWWTIPSSKTKNKKDHRVFLTDLALSLMGEPAQSGYFFPSDKKNGHIDRNALSRALRRNQVPEKPLSEIEYFSAHDLRRTAATHLARIGHASIVGKILNHTDRSITTVYDHRSLTPLCPQFSFNHSYFKQIFFI